MRGIIREGFKLSENKAYEGMMTYGNGYMNIRGGFEFDSSHMKQTEKYMRFPDNVTLEKPKNGNGKWGIFVSGIVGSHPLLNEEMVNLPYFLGINIIIDDQQVEILDHIVDFSSTLHIDQGILSYRLTFLYDAELFTLESLRCADIKHKHYHHQEMRIETQSQKKIVLESFIDGGVTTNGYNHFVKNKSSYLEKGLDVCVETDLGQTIQIIQKIKTDGEKCYQRKRDGRISIFHLLGPSKEIIKDTFISTSRECTSCEIENYCFDKNEQKRLWGDIWKEMDVIIKGDEVLQDKVRYSIFHLFRSKKAGDEFVAIDAKGVAGEAYFGHYFWDTEIYLLPFYLYTNPDMAKELLMFRVHTLQQAKENAKAYGYRGAKYPWESSISGKEQCSNWQYKDLEIHVSFDIAYGMYQYYKVTGDWQTMERYFLEVLIEVSTFIVDRSYVDEEGAVHINGVMGPDEYLAFTNDNAFTNHTAKFVLKKTVELMKHFNRNDERQKVFETTAAHMTLHCDDEKKLVWQCQDFEKLEEIDFDKVWLDRNQPFGRFISQEKNYRTKALKQGDVICLHYMFEKDYDEVYVRNALDYYEPLTTHDSSLSYIIHSILFAKTGDLQRSYRFLTKSMDIDFGCLGAGEGIHIANCGGVYQSVLYGLCGLVNPMFTDKLEFYPNLPSSIQKIETKIKYKGKSYKIKITQKDVCVEEE